MSVVFLTLPGDSNLQCCKNSTYRDTQVRANSADQDHTAPKRSSEIRFYIVCQSICIFLNPLLYSKSKLFRFVGQLQLLHCNLRYPTPVYSDFLSNPTPDADTNTIAAKANAEASASAPSIHSYRRAKKCQKSKQPNP